MSKEKLPELCAAVHDGRPIFIRRGETGYYDAAQVSDMATMLSAEEFVDLWNTTEGVTKALVEAMLAGSMFGFDVPAADPSAYDDAGRPRRG